MPEWAKAPWLQDLFQSVAPRLPKLGIALAVLIGGWLVAVIVSRSVFAALRRTTLDDRIAEAVGVETGGAAGSRVETIVSKAIYYALLAFVVVAFFSYLGISAVTTPLVTVLDGFAGAIPNLAKAVVIGFVGFLVATGVRRLIISVLTKLNFEQRMQRLGGEEAVAVAEEVTDKKKKKKTKAAPEPVTNTLGEVAYWFIIVVTAIPVLEALRIGVLAGPLSSAFSSVATYLPKIAAAAVLLVVGYLLARMVRALVSGVLARVGLDRAMARLGFGKVTQEHSLSGILGAVAMAFVLLHFAVSAVGRLDIQEISTPLRLMLDQVYVYLPKLFVGGVLMAIGVVVARVAGNVVARLLAAMGFNTLMVHVGLYKDISAAAKQQEQQSKALLKQRQAGQGAASEDDDQDEESPNSLEPDALLGTSGSGGLNTPADIAGVVVAAFVVLLFMRQVLATTGLTGLAQLLDSLIAYLPNALVAVVLLGAGLWAGRWAHARVDELTRNSTDRIAKALGSVSHVGIVAFAGMMAMQQLGVGRQLIAIAFALLLGSVCLAAALAFGLGGRDVAAKILDKEYQRRQRGQ